MCSDQIGDCHQVRVAQKKKKKNEKKGKEKKKRHCSKKKKKKNGANAVIYDWRHGSQIRLAPTPSDKNGAIAVR